MVHFLPPVIYTTRGLALYSICEIHLESSRQFVASVFDTPIVVRIYGNLYIFIVVISIECIVTTQQYSVVTWYYIDSIFPDPICTVYLETSHQFVDFAFGVLCSVGIATITDFVTCSNMSFI